MNIIFDFDGTLLDSRLRLYKLFQDLVPSSKLTYEEYWKYKRNKIPHETILIDVFNYDSSDISKFKSAWLELIETEVYLKLDTLYANVNKSLEQLAKTNCLYLCTARQHREPVLTQLESLGIIEYFSEVFVTEQVKTKEELLNNSSICFSNIDCFVGDTGHDILTGKALGLRTYAVTTGFLSKNKLLQYKPDVFLNDLSELKPILY